MIVLTFEATDDSSVNYIVSTLYTHLAT